MVAWSGIYRLGRAHAESAPQLQHTVYRPPIELDNGSYLMPGDTLSFHGVWSNDSLASREILRITGDSRLVFPPDESARYLQSTLPDVIEQPAESVDLVTRLWREGHIAQALIVAAFLALTIASRRVPWLSEGHRAVYVAAIVTGLGMLAETASRGTTPNISMVVGALLTAATLVMNGKAPAQVAAGLPFARALRAPAALAIEPRPTRRQLEEVARDMHRAFTDSMGVPQAWHNLSDDTRKHWLAAAEATAGQ